jgi:hypothetical protein
LSYSSERLEFELYFGVSGIRVAVWTVSNSSCSLDRLEFELQLGASGIRVTVGSVWNSSCRSGIHFVFTSRWKRNGQLKFMIKVQTDILYLNNVIQRIKIQKGRVEKVKLPQSLIN